MKVSLDGTKTNQQWERWKPTNKVKLGKIISERESCTFEEALESVIKAQQLVKETLGR